MMKHSPIIAVLAFVIILFASCRKRCGPAADYITLTFVKNGQNIDPGYDRVYGIDQNNNIKDDLPYNDFESSIPGYRLPLSVKVPQVTFVFEKNNQPQDTLILEYDLNFGVDQKECINLLPKKLAISRQSTLVPLSPLHYQNIESTSRLGPGYTIEINAQ